MIGSLARDVLRRAAHGEPQVAGLFGEYDAAWQPQEDAMLIDLRARGLVYKQIARLVGKSASACATRYCRIMEQKL